MYPGSIFNWHDQSAITTNTVENVDNTPLYALVSSFERGPEDLRVVSGQSFYNLYGSKMSFAANGQPAIQAANIINGGGRLLLKRLVATDALLANVIFTATISAVQTLKVSTDAGAMSLAYFTTGTDDASATTKYVVDSTATTLKWAAVSATNCKTYAEVSTAANKLISKGTPASATVENSTNMTVSTTSTFPVVIASDNGRGVSSKAIRFVPDYTTSKDLANMYYNVYVYSGTTKLEDCICTLDPTVVYNNTLYGLSEDTSDQLHLGVSEEGYAAFMTMLETATGYTEAQLKHDDLIFCTDYKKSSISGLTLSKESVDLGASYGVELQNGSNGAFGDAPWADKTSDAFKAWTAAAVAVFDGTFDDIIWDTDTYKLTAIFDADYPDEVKKAIATLVTFREDCFYFRDYGTEVDSYLSIAAKHEAITDDYRNKFIGDYCTTYKIYDPETKVRTKVTMMYDFARAAVTLFASGAYKPIAGIANGMILTNAIEGTINFTPRITPTVNQKTLMDDARINYAIFQNGSCAVQSLYTSQNAYTQLSYANNVLAMQEVVRAVRTACPKQRYTFVSGNDFTVYADAVNTVLKNYKSNFDDIQFSYTQNNLKANQKIFYATISFMFNNWAQTEVFDLFALNSDES